MFRVWSSQLCIEWSRLIKRTSDHHLYFLSFVWTSRAQDVYDFNSWWSGFPDLGTKSGPNPIDQSLLTKGGEWNDCWEMKARAGGLNTSGRFADANSVDDIELYDGLHWLERKHVLGKVVGWVSAHESVFLDASHVRIIGRFLPYVGYVTIALVRRVPHPHFSFTCSKRI